MSGTFSDGYVRVCAGLAESCRPTDGDIGLSRGRGTDAVLAKEVLDLRARVAELEAERFAVAEAVGMVIQAEGHNPVAAPMENVVAAIKEAVDAVDTLCDLQVLLDPHRIDTEMQHRDGTLEHGSYPEWETDYQVVRRLLAERDDHGEAIGEAYRDGARSMRERAAAHVDAEGAAHKEQVRQWRNPAIRASHDATMIVCHRLAAAIRALPLDEDAREDDAGGSPWQPPFNLHRFLAQQREWSERTFGPGPRPLGITDHIRKELCEIEAEPDDLEEWIDVVLLALDGAWRAGYSPGEIIAQLDAKQAKNRARQWPKASDPLKATEHVRDAQGGERA